MSKGIFINLLYKTRAKRIADLIRTTDDFLSNQIYIEGNHFPILPSKKSAFIRVYLWLNFLAFSTRSGRVFKKEVICSVVESAPRVIRREPNAHSRG